MGCPDQDRAITQGSSSIAEKAHDWKNEMKQEWVKKKSLTQTGRTKQGDEKESWQMLEPSGADAPPKSRPPTSSEQTSMVS